MTDCWCSRCLIVSILGINYGSLNAEPSRVRSPAFWATSWDNNLWPKLFKIQVKIIQILLLLLHTGGRKFFQGNVDDSWLTSSEDFPWSYYVEDPGGSGGSGAIFKFLWQKTIHFHAIKVENAPFLSLDFINSSHSLTGHLWGADWNLVDHACNQRALIALRAFIPPSSVALNCHHFTPDQKNLYWGFQTLGRSARSNTWPNSATWARHPLLFLLVLLRFCASP